MKKNNIIKNISTIKRRISQSCTEYHTIRSSLVQRDIGYFVVFKNNNKIFCLCDIKIAITQKQSAQIRSIYHSVVIIFYLRVWCFMILVHIFCQNGRPPCSLNQCDSKRYFERQ